MKHGTYHFDNGTSVPAARPAFAAPQEDGIVDLYHTADDYAPFATRVPVSAEKARGTWTPDEDATPSQATPEAGGPAHNQTLAGSTPAPATNPTPPETPEEAGSQSDETQSDEPTPASSPPPSGKKKAS